MHVTFKGNNRCCGLPRRRSRASLAFARSFICLLKDECSHADAADAAVFSLKPSDSQAAAAAAEGFAGFPQHG